MTGTVDRRKFLRAAGVTAVGAAAAGVGGELLLGKQFRSGPKTPPAAMAPSAPSPSMSPPPQLKIDPMTPLPADDLFLSLAIFVFVNIASLGATYTVVMLQPFWRFFNHIWLGAGAVNAERSLLYFDGSGFGMDVLRLVIWMAIIVAVLFLQAACNRARHSGELLIAEATAVTTPSFALNPQS